MSLSPVQLPELMNEIPNGVYECEILQASLHRDIDGPILFNGDYVPIITFRSDAGLVTQKAFKMCTVYDSKLFSKLVAIAGEEIIGKLVSVFIQKVINSETKEFYYRITNFKPAGKKYRYTNSEVYE